MSSKSERSIRKAGRILRDAAGRFYTLAGKPVSREVALKMIEKRELVMSDPGILPGESYAQVFEITPP